MSVDCLWNSSYLVDCCLGSAYKTCRYFDWTNRVFDKLQTHMHCFSNCVRLGNVCPWWCSYLVDCWLGAAYTTCHWIPSCLIQSSSWQPENPNGLLPKGPIEQEWVVFGKEIVLTWQIVNKKWLTRLATEATRSSAARALVASSNKLLFTPSWAFFRLDTCWTRELTSASATFLVTVAASASSVACTPASEDIVAKLIFAMLLDPKLENF